MTTSRQRRCVGAPRHVQRPLCFETSVRVMVASATPRAPSAASTSSPVPGAASRVTASTPHRWMTSSPPQECRRARSSGTSAARRRSSTRPPKKELSEWGRSSLSCSTATPVRIRVDTNPPCGGVAPQSRQPRVRHDPVGVADMSGGIAGSRPALPDPPALYRRPQAHRRIGATVRDAGHLPPDADTEAVAATLLSLMFGMIVMHHVVDDVPADALRTGVGLLGAATHTPTLATSHTSQTTS